MDRFWADEDTFRIGKIDVRVMLSPGHTLGSITYVAGDAAFVHDTFMQPNAGTSRADFPGGSASELYESLQAILALPRQTRLFVGHDYGTKDCDEPAWESTVAEQAADNTHLSGGTSKADYIKLREDRDATLALPDRILAALQVNLRGGRLPKAKDDGHRYLKLPLNRFQDIAMRPFVPRRLEHVAFGFLLSCLMSLLISGLATFLAIGAAPGFVPT